MPVDWAGLGAKQSPGIIDWESLGARPSPTSPGDSPENPLDDELPDQDRPSRLKMMNLTASSGHATREIQRLGFEAVDQGNYNISVKSKQDGRWYRLDPKKGGFKEFAKDVGDIGGGISNLAFQVGGHIAGAAAGSPSGPGAVASSVAGGVAASGLEEAGRVGLIGKAFGLDPSLADVGKAAGREMLYAGVGEGLALAAKPTMGAAKYLAGKTTSGVGKALGGPLRLEKFLSRQGGQEALTQRGLDLSARGAGLGAKLKSGQTIRQALKERGMDITADAAGLTARKAGARNVGRELSGKSATLTGAAQRVMSETQGPLTAKAAARATLEEARARYTKELSSRLAKEEAKAAPIRSALKRELAEEPTEAARATNVIEELDALSRSGGSKRFVFAGSMFDPRTSHSAKALRLSPRLRKVYREVFGREFVPEEGSLSMAHRATQVEGMLNDLPDEIYQAKMGKLHERLAEFALTSEETKAFSEASKAAMKRAMKGSKAPEDIQIVLDSVNTIVEKVKPPAYLTGAGRAYRETIAPAARATATRAGARETYLKGRLPIEKEGAGLRKTVAGIGREEVGLASRRAALARSRKTAEGAFAGLSREAAGIAGDRAALAADRAAFGSEEVLRPPVLGSVNRMLAFGGMGLDRLGKWMRSKSPEAVEMLASDAPPGVRREIMKAIKVARTRGLDAYRVALFTVMRIPAVREWLESAAREGYQAGRSTAG